MVHKLMVVHAILYVYLQIRPGSFGFALTVSFCCIVIGFISL